VHHHPPTHTHTPPTHPSPHSTPHPLQDTVETVMSILGMQPCEGTEAVPPNARSHTVLLSGQFPGDERALVRCVGLCLGATVLGGRRWRCLSRAILAAVWQERREWSLMLYLSVSCMSTLQQVLRLTPLSWWRRRLHTLPLGAHADRLTEVVCVALTCCSARAGCRLA
jgi:hypothetical protein